MEFLVESLSKIDLTNEAKIICSMSDLSENDIIMLNESKHLSFDCEG